MEILNRKKMFLQKALEFTEEIINSQPKENRKKIGQFFTSKETAIFMADMFDLKKISGTVKILDPGAGTGILSAALIGRLNNLKSIDSIHLVCYETDSIVLPSLFNLLEYIKENCKKKFSYEVRNRDYILTQAEEFEANDLISEKFDLVIGNPPYKKILKSNPIAQAMPSIIHGAPNLYFIFTSMALFNLAKGAELVFIIPRSWVSGAYFKKFREYILNNGIIKQIHLFVSRDKVFNKEQVLQETIIIKIQKKNDKAISRYITVSSSNSSKDFENIVSNSIPSSTIISGKENYVFLPTNAEELNTLNLVNRYNKTLPDLGIKMKTGIVVDFRQRTELRKDPAEHVIPLFYSQHIKQGRVNHLSSGKNYDWIVDNNRSLIQSNKDYVFCKRFAAKEEPRRLQCGIYLSEDFSEYEFIGTENKINFIEKIDGTELSKESLFGIFALLNSTLFDNYYRILNGSTQVNSTEVNQIPVPSLSVINKIGNVLLKSNNLSTSFCDKVLKDLAYE